MKKKLLIIGLIFTFGCEKEQITIEDDKLTDQRDGKIYETVEIGGQVWMAENLAYYTGVGSRAYDGDFNNIGIYGYLYDYETAQNVCPDGWSLPTHNDFKQLVNFVEDRAGDLKTTTLWNEPNTGANNMTGFSGKPAGVGFDGFFRHLGYHTAYWSRDELDENYGYMMLLAYNRSNIILNTTDKNFGISVRCIKN